MKTKKKKTNQNMKLVTALLPESYLVGLDELVRTNMYQNRSAAIRMAVRDMLKEELWRNSGKTSTGSQERSK